MQQAVLHVKCIAGAGLLRQGLAHFFKYKKKVWIIEESAGLERIWWWKQLKWFCEVAPLSTENEENYL